MICFFITFLLSINSNTSYGTQIEFPNFFSNSTNKEKSSVSLNLSKININTEFLDYVEKYKFDFICLIFKGLLLGPKVCKGCDKNYCNNCIQRMNNTCQDNECRSTEFDIIKKQSIINKFEKVRIMCINNCGDKTLNFLNYYLHL